MDENIKKILNDYKKIITGLIRLSGDDLSHGRWHWRIHNGFNPLEAAIISNYLNAERILLIGNYGYKIFPREFTINDFTKKKEELDD